MFKMAIFLKRLPVLCRIKTVYLNSYPQFCRYSDNVIDMPDMGPPIPPYKKKQGETNDVRKARLLYQSRCVAVRVGKCSYISCSYMLLYYIRKIFVGAKMFLYFLILFSLIYFT